VPFVRFARDKRGYEYVYLVHESTRGGRAARPLVLYWYRTPPGVRVGRPPFDEEVRQRLEAQNPEIRFDWRAITSAQPPPPDAEHWRERRRAEKAMKQARLKEERADPDEGPPDDEDAPGDRDVFRGPAEAGADEPPAVLALDAVSTEQLAVAAAGQPAAEGTSSAPSAAAPARAHRRRRGRRRKPRPGGSEAGATTAAPSLANPGEAEDAEDSGPEEPEDS
jgi:hypothetical protein